MTRYWHGGVRGLRPGDMLVPPSEHDGPTLMEYIQHVTYDNEPAKEQARSGKYVFVTTNKKFARAFAALYPPTGGALYQVEPVGEIGDDHDCPGQSFVCERARVVAVYDAWVPLDPKALDVLSGASR